MNNIQIIILKIIRAIYEYNFLHKFIVYIHINVFSNFVRNPIVPLNV